MKTLQKIAKAANAKRHSKQTYWQFIEVLNQKEKTAVIVANFIEQMEIGIEQWLKNSYYSSASVEKNRRSITKVQRRTNRTNKDHSINTNR